MKIKLLGLVLPLLLLCKPAWAVDLCSISSIGTAVTATSATVLNFNLPGTYVAGDLLVTYSASLTANDAVSVAPSGYTQIKADAGATGVLLYGKVATLSESAPSVTYSGGSNLAGFMVAIHNPGGWPALGSILGDSTTGTSATVATLEMRALTVTVGGGCALQFAKKITNTTGGSATAITATSGYVLAGSAFLNSGSSSLVLGAQLFNGDATTPDLSTQNLTVTGNTTSTTDREMSLTLLSGDNTPTAFSFTDKTSQAISSTISSVTVTLAGFDNYVPIQVGAGSDTGCKYSLDGGAYTSTAGYAAVGQTLSAQVTSSGSYSTTTNCIIQLVGASTVQDTFSVTTTTAPVTSEIQEKDLFTGTNGTSITAHSADVSQHAWTINDFYSGAGAGTVTIQSNKLNVAGTQTTALTDVDTADAAVTVDWTPTAAATNRADIILRYVDSSNWWACRFSEQDSRVQLWRKLAGVDTFFTSVATTLTEGVTYSITGFAQGNTLGCALNGTLKTTTSASNFNTSELFGVGSETSTVVQVFDNLYIMKARSAFATATGRIGDDPNGVFFGENPGSGSAFWLGTDCGHCTLTLRNGGSFKWVPTQDYVGGDTAGLIAYNSTTAALDTATLSVTTQDTTLVAPVWQAAAINLSLPIGVAYSNNLCTNYLTTQGVPQATITKTSGTLVQGLAMTDSCTLAGTPTLGYTAAQSATFTATNGTGAPTKAIGITITGDSVPDFPDFTDISNATPSTLTSCTAVTMTGTDVPGVITVTGDSGAKYSINGGAYTSSSGFFSSGDTVAAQVTSGTAGTTKIVTVTAGGVSRTCDVTATALAADGVNPFTFTVKRDVALNSAQSDCALISGNTALSAVTVSGGTCTINGGSCPGNLPVGGGTVCAAHTAAGTINTATNTLVTIGGTVGTFTSITLGNGPVCVQVPNVKSYVGQTFTADLSTYCPNTISFSMNNPISDCAVNGGTISCTFTTPNTGFDPSLRTVSVSASNNSGSSATNITFEVSAAVLEDTRVLSRDITRDVNSAVNTDL